MNHIVNEPCTFGRQIAIGLRADRRSSASRITRSSVRRYLVPQILDSLKQSPPVGSDQYSQVIWTQTAMVSLEEGASKRVLQQFQAMACTRQRKVHKRGRRRQASCLGTTYDEKKRDEIES